MPETFRDRGDRLWEGSVGEPDDKPVRDPPRPYTLQHPGRWKMDQALLKEEIEETLWFYIRDNCLPRDAGARISQEENLFDCGILDSAGLIAFVVYLENKFHISIPDEDLLPENFTSLESITRYILGRERSGPA